MPRYYRRRYTRVVKPKKRWASNIKDLAAAMDPNNPDAHVILYVDLVSNSTQTASPTPVIVKTGNFKVQTDVSYTINVASPVDVRTVVVYVPEGVTYRTPDTAKDLINKHPEWIMGWKYASIDYVAGSVQSGIQTINFSSRLKRNLNSGDKIVLITFLDTVTNGSSVTGARQGGLCQYWTCAN